MAHKKGQGSTRNGRDSLPKMRGVKRFGGETVTAGSILVRQVGTKFHAGDNVGKPLVAGAKVTGQIVEQGRGEKLVVFKFRRRKNYVRRNGHRQDYTAVKIAAIQA